jgi:glutamate 5-kinase
MSELKNARRIVVKVGSSLVTNEGRGSMPRQSATGAVQLAALVRRAARW